MLRGLLYYTLLLFGRHKSSLGRNVREVVLAVHAPSVTCRSSQAAQRQLHVIRGCIKPCILTFRHFWSSKCLTFHHLIPLIQSLCVCHTTQYSCSVGMEKHIKIRCYKGVFNLFFLQQTPRYPGAEKKIRFISWGFANIFCEQIVTAEHVTSQNTRFHQSCSTEDWEYESHYQQSGICIKCISKQCFHIMTACQKACILNDFENFSQQ